MREILFRGKRMKDRAWIEGFYCEFANNMSGEQEHFIQTVKSDGRIDTLYHVDPASVGQYTGLTDKNGKRIFEGDIVEGIDYTAEDGGYGIVKFDDGAFEVLGNCIVGTFHDNYWGHDFEVIGNIHDNSEMLEGGTDNA